MTQPLFHTITSADWKRSLARASTDINPLHAQIGRAALVACLPRRQLIVMSKRELLEPRAPARPYRRDCRDGPALEMSQAPSKPLEEELDKTAL